MKKSVMQQVKKFFVAVACVAMAVLTVNITELKAQAASSVDFFVLNRELSTPSEPCVGTYPKSNYSAGVSGSVTNYSKPLGEGVVDNIGGYIVNAPTKQQLANVGVTLADYEGINWYVIKTEDDGIHVDGVITDQRVTITVRYGYLDGDNRFVELAPTVSNVYQLGESYSIPSPVIAGYATSLATVSGTASSTITYDVLYTTEATQKVVINYYRTSVNGTKLGSTQVDVAESQLAGYFSQINSSWLNLYKPTDCYAGTVASYAQDENGVWVANVVYAPIPVTPVKTNPADGSTDGSYTNGGVVVTEYADAETAPVTIRRPVEEAEEAEEEPEVEDITDEVIPRNDGLDSEDNKADIAVNMLDGIGVDIQDEDAPLSARGKCYIHWIILLLTVIYTIFALIRCGNRNKRIKEIEKMQQSLQA